MVGICPTLLYNSFELFFDRILFCGQNFTIIDVEELKHFPVVWPIEKFFDSQKDLKSSCQEQGRHNLSGFSIESLPEI